MSTNPNNDYDDDDIENVFPPEKIYRISEGLRTGPMRIIDNMVRRVFVGSKAARRDYWIDITGTNWFICYNDLSYKYPSFDVRNASDVDGDAKYNADTATDLGYWLADCLHAGGPLLTPHEKFHKITDFLMSMEKEREEIAQEAKEQPTRFWKYCLVMTGNVWSKDNPDGPRKLCHHVYFDAANHYYAGTMRDKLAASYTWHYNAVFVCEENRLVRQLTLEELTTPPAPPAPTDEDRRKALDEINETIKSSELLTVTSIQEILKKYGL